MDMTSTMSFGSIYPGFTSTQSQTNPPAGTAKTPVADPSSKWGSVPVLPGVASGLGVSVPVLLALGVMAWWLFRQYD